MMNTLNLSSIQHQMEQNPPPRVSHEPIQVTNSNANQTVLLTPFGAHVSKNGSNQKTQFKTPITMNSNLEPVRSELVFSNLELAHRFSEIEAMIQRRPKMQPPIKKTAVDNFANSPFVDEIALLVSKIDGTFSIRSGLLAPVHSFATDDTRGIFLWRFFLLMTGISMILFSQMKQQASVRRTYKKEMVVARSTLVHLRHSARAQPRPVMLWKN
ncbi:hypothetical protein Ddye_022793 [Dipteronia dyeriana]|uniref:Uncharacterized protein n=1 Tax=Dipteronia dyeriana TaxID=168575 RepID=A0AAD9TRR3_9ROSI|nr:hypothetical protein Ddye_022793 [Dipteronia dyeriana]